MNSKQWYVLRVKPRYERVTGKTLAANGFEPFVPTYTEVRRWSDRRKSVALPLFPGYVFCRFVRGQHAGVLKSPGVVSVVSFGETLAVVSEEEISSIRSIVASGLRAQPCPYLNVGDRVTIEGGCLAGVQGILVREKATVRVVVTVTILQRSVEVELDRAMISAPAVGA